MPTIVDLPKRQRSGAYRFTDAERDETLALLSQAKTGQAVTVTDVFKYSDYEPKDNLSAEQVARNVASGRNNTIREALEPHIDDDFHVMMHVIEQGNGKNAGVVGAVSLRQGPKPERKERKPSVRRRKDESLESYNARRAEIGLEAVES